MSLKIGDIVTVTNESISLYGRQGQVVDIRHDGNEEGSFLVKFGYSCKGLMDCRQNENDVLRFSSEELRLDEEWEIENWAIDLFKRSFSKIKYLMSPWTPKTPCMHAGHAHDDTEKPSVRSLVNLLGSVYEIPLCEKHHDQYHGTLIETFPFRQ